MYLLNKSVYFCWCSGTLQLRCPFSTQPKASSVSGTRCFHPSPAQPRPGEPSRGTFCHRVRKSFTCVSSSRRHCRRVKPRFPFGLWSPPPGVAEAPLQRGLAGAVSGLSRSLPGGYGCTDPPRSCKAPLLLALGGQGPVSVVSTM